MWIEAFQLEFFSAYQVWLSSIFIKQGNMESTQFQLPHLAQQEQTYEQIFRKL